MVVSEIVFKPGCKIVFPSWDLAKCQFSTGIKYFLRLDVHILITRISWYAI